MTVQEQKKVVEELKPLWIHPPQKAHQLRIHLFLTKRQQTNDGYQWMMCGDVDVTIKDGKMRTRCVYGEYRVEEETTSLPAASEK